MSTISDAVRKKRDEEDHPSPETAPPRLVQVDVPKDHTVRNVFLGVVLAAIVLAGGVVGSYALIQTMRKHRQPGARPTTGEAPSGGVVEPSGQGGVEAPTATHPEVEPPALPELQGIFPDPIEPTAVLNGRRVRLGGVVDGYTLVAVEEDGVVVERDGTRHELMLK